MSVRQQWEPNRTRFFAVARRLQGESSGLPQASLKKTGVIAQIGLNLV